MDMVSSILSNEPFSKARLAAFCSLSIDDHDMPGRCLCCCYDARSLSIPSAPLTVGHDDWMALAAARDAMGRTKVGVKMQVKVGKVEFELRG